MQQHRYSAIDREKLVYWQKSLSLYHFHMNYLGPRQGFCNKLSSGHLSCSMKISQLIQKLK